MLASLQNHEIPPPPSPPHKTYGTPSGNSRNDLSKISPINFPFDTTLIQKVAFCTNFMFGDVLQRLNCALYKMEKKRKGGNMRRFPRNRRAFVSPREKVCARGILACDMLMSVLATAGENIRRVSFLFPLSSILTKRERSSSGSSSCGFRPRRSACQDSRRIIDLLLVPI